MKNTSRILALLLALLTVLSAFAMVGCDSNETPNNAETQDTSEGVTEEDINTETNAETEEETKKPANTPTGFGFEGVDWINAEKFGFVSDGKTPNDRIMREYIQYYSDTPLYFGKGVYAFEKTINFTDCVYLHLDPKAELKCIAEEPIEYFITLRGQYQDIDNAWGSLWDYAHQSYISGGVINANNKAKCGLGLFQGMHTNFENFRIQNVLEKGIQTLISKTTDGCSNFYNLYIYNEKTIKGSIGVYDNGWDNHFNGVTVLNFDTAFWTKGGRFVECSAWINDKTSVDTCTFARIEGTQSVWYNPSVDTMRYGFVFGDNASTSIIDMTWITNYTFYSEYMQEKYARTLFVFNGNSARMGTSVVGLQINTADKYLSFSNVEAPNSLFLNVRAPHADPETEIKNFRNDSATLMGIAESVGTKKTGNLTATVDLDKLYDNGIYKCEFRTGSGGKSIPAKEVGVLEVEAVSDIVIQTFTGSDTTMQRVFNGIRWSDWRTVAE